MRFLAAQHLRRPSEIRIVREQGQRIDCRTFTVWWKRRDAKSADSALSPLMGPARVCVIASTAAVGNAVRRNRAKRKLREIFRRQQDALAPDCDLLLIARGAIVESPMLDLEKRFADACRRINTTPNANL
jgi:ribonuclease P protein component